MDESEVSSTPHTGVIVAPAGYGKTHRLTEMLAQPGKYLVLTHTNAAVGNIKRRHAAGAGTRIETIDSFASRLAHAFPSVSKIAAGSPDWESLRVGAVAALERPAIRSSLAISYDQVLVDEYQDCTSDQVLLLGRLAAVIPTIVFGDPLQSIFDPLAKGERRMTWHDKTRDLPLLEQLQTPWRWRSTPDHQRWVAQARSSVESGAAVSLAGPTAHLVRKTQTTGDFLSETIKSRGGSLAIIVGDSKRPHLLGDIAKRHSWCFTEVAELAHPRELDQFAGHWDGGNTALAVLELTKACMTNCGKVTSFDTCLRNAAQQRTNRAKSELAELANALTDGGEPADALRLIEFLYAHHGTRTYRPDLLGRVKRALRLAAQQPMPMNAAVEAVQNQVRAGFNRRPTGPLVGSVLRLKGLEFDHVVIVEPDAFGTKEEVYVAVSRAQLSCTVVAGPRDSLRWFAA